MEQNALGAFTEHFVTVLCACFSAAHEAHPFFKKKKTFQPFWPLLGLLQETPEGPDVGHDPTYICRCPVAPRYAMLRYVCSLTVARFGQKSL